MRSPLPFFVRWAALGVLLVPLSSRSEPAVTNVQVILVGGQSNADGRAPGQDLPKTPVNLQAEFPNIPIYVHTHGAPGNAEGSLGHLTTLHPGLTQMPEGAFGPEILLGATLAPVVESRPGHRLALIKYAKGGSALCSDWKPDGSKEPADGPHYQIFQTVVQQGMEALKKEFPGAKIRCEAMIWVQGETDADRGTQVAETYASHLETFIRDIRATIRPDLPFFLSQLSWNQTGISAEGAKNRAGFERIRAAQARVAATVPGVTLVGTDTPEFSILPDGVHFSAEGQMALGKAFAREIAKILATPAPAHIMAE